jgi:hypothetical protein
LFLQENRRNEHHWRDWIGQRIVGTKTNKPAEERGRRDGHYDVLSEDGQVEQRFAKKKARQRVVPMSKVCIVLLRLL